MSDNELIFGMSWSDIQTLQQGGNPRRNIVNTPGIDYGADPLGDGTFRMVPSGDIVDWAERCKRLPLPR